MKRLLSMFVLAAAVSMLTGGLLAQEKSDYEVVKAFELRTKALQKQIEEAKTVQDCADIAVSLDQINAEFAADQALLDKALYGEKFEERVTRLRVQLRLNQDKLGVIEAQVSRIADLEEQVRSLSAQVEKLSGENTQLMADIERLSSNVKGLSASGISANSTIDSLNKVIGRLQQGLKERDNMIFALIDSMFMQYNKEVGQMADTEKRGLVMKLDRNNIVSAVKNSIENNIKFLARTELKGTDLASVLSEQNKFASQWRGLGPKLAGLYVSNKNREKELAAVDTLLAAWSNAATSAYWRGLNAAFTSRQIPVNSFTNGSEFAANVSSYVDGQMKTEGTNDDKLKSYESFQGLWGEELHPAWIPLMVSRGDLTADQAKGLEEKVESWKSSVTPTSPVMYLAIFVAIVAILAIVYTQMKKKPLAPTA